MMLRVDKLPPPTPRLPPPANIGAEAPTHDTSTTGQTPTSTTRAPSAGEQVLEGMGERALELLPQLVWGIIDANMGGGASTLVQAKPGDLKWEGGGGRMADKLNEANPLYVASINVIDGANAYDNGDYIGVGRSVLGIGVTARMTAITLEGAKTTRAPPLSTAPIQYQPTSIAEVARMRETKTPERLNAKETASSSVL